MPLPSRVDRTILFICTGNYYRSRFAEALFNHHAELRGLNWRAISRGLAMERVIEINKLSRFTLAAMLQRGIKRQHTSEDLNALTSLDLIETHLANVRGRAPANDDGEVSSLGLSRHILACA